MIKTPQTMLLIILLCLVQIGNSEVKTKVKVPIKRSYGFPQVAYLNDAQGFQYYAANPLYTAIPTVFLPSQIGLSAAPIANIVLPQSGDPKPVQELIETSTASYGPRIPMQIYKQKHRSHGYVQAEKRPLSYVNSLYGQAVRMKPISSVPVHKPKVSIQQSVDLSGQFSQEAASNLYPTTVSPPVVSTYGPPKTVNVGSKTRITGTSPTVYHRLKGASHRHPIYPPKKMRVYSHVHKDHIHSHYLPSNYPPSTFKVQGTKYAAPPYLPPASPTSSTLAQENPVYAYQPTGQVRFPENQDHLQTPVQDQEIHKPNYTPGGLTQAIIKNPGVINNYDANIPIHVPSKKPYKFEVNEILKNSELHFVQEAPDTKNNEVINTNGDLDYSQHLPYQNALLFSPQKTIYNPLSVDQSNIIAAPNPLDLYTLPGVNAYQTNYIAPEQDLGTSETVKVPVAIIKGAHNIASQNMYGITMKRQDEKKPQKDEVKKPFSPSRRTSDWVPMSGNGVPIATKEETSEESSETFRRDFLSPKKNTKPVRQPVGDIISGKIPEEFSPKSGKIPFLRSSERDKRKGSVIDVSPSSSELSKIGDTSDLVVSSVIKFS